MKILTKLMLTTAILATGGFAAGTTINEDMVDQDGWDITGTDNATIAAGKTVIMQGIEGAASNLTISEKGSLTNNGIVALHDASSIIVSSNADTPFSNIGVVDLSEVTDFSNFVVDILNANGAKIIVPAPGDFVTSGDNAKFKFTAPSGDGETFVIEYAGGTYELKVSGQMLIISGVAEKTYADLAAVKSKLGMTVDNDTKAILQSPGASMSLLDVINDSLNKNSNNDKTFDLDQAGLSSKEAALTADKTIHFGFVGAVGNDMKLKGNYKTTFTGDNSGMLSKIATEGDAVFTGKAPQGALEIAGNLLVDHSGEAQTLAGEIKAGSVTIPTGTKLTFSSKLTTGWSNRLLWKMPIFDSLLDGYYYEIVNNGGTTISLISSCNDTLLQLKDNWIGVWTSMVCCYVGYLDCYNSDTDELDISKLTSEDLECYGSYTAEWFIDVLTKLQNGSYSLVKRSTY